MKLFSYNIKDLNKLDACLNAFRANCPKNPYSILCMVITSLDYPELVRQVAGHIKEVLPEVTVCGTTTSGEIGGAKIHQYTHEICFYVFESSTVDVLFYDGHERDLAAAADDVVHRAENHKPVAVGMLATMKTLNGGAEIFSRLGALPDGVSLFGGSADSYAEKNVYVNETPTYVFTDTSCTNRGFIALLYYGEDLHIYIKSYLGWHPLGNEAVVTGVAPDNRILTVNNESILSFYEKYIGAVKGPNFFASVMPFPLIANHAGHEIACIPIGYDEDGSMRFTSTVREGELVRLGYGDPGEMLSQSRIVRQELRQFAPEGILLIPCIVRNIYFKNDFELEINPFGAIAPTVGFLSYGEMQRFKDWSEPQLMNGAMIVIAFREGAAHTVLDVAEIPEPNANVFTDERMTLAGGLARFISVITGELEQKQEQILQEREKREEEEAARRAAILANEAKTSFLFNMSHDIRTPMNAIIGFTNLLEKSLDNKAKSLDYIKKIQESNHFLLSLINNVLEMARIESGKATVDDSYGSVSAMVEAISAVFEPLGMEKNISFTCSCDVVHDNVMADKTKLREILLNLLSNAFKYTPAGGRISYTVKEIAADTVGFKLKTGYTLLETVISDTGIGMPEEFLPELFEAFTREKNTTQSGIQGTGLGMMIVKKLVILLGGTIDVESHLGKGTTFVMRIPHRIAEKPDAAHLTSAEETAEVPDYSLFKGLHVLLAEDNDLNAEIARFVLEDKGFIVDRAVDGVDCIDKLTNTIAGHYALILMDVQMPRMDGYKATETIRRMQDKIKASIPVIAMTANAFDEDKINAAAAGMNAHIAKPFDVDVLYETIYNVLRGTAER